MIRGKLESYRDLPRQNIVVGDPIFEEKNGEWFLIETGEKIEVEILSFDQLLPDAIIEPSLKS